MRRNGHVESVSGLGVSDHVCWSFDDIGDFVDAGVQWVRDGVALGQRLVYVADRTIDELQADLGAVDGVDALVERGALTLTPIESIYPGGGPVDPQAQLAFYAAATDAAIADGFRGLRVLAEVTELVRDPSHVDTHVRWEQLVDGYMTAAPLAAMCGYDRTVVGDSGSAALCSVHPLRHDPHELAAFALYPNDGGLLLEGALESYSRAQLERLLRHAPIGTDGEVLLDVGGVGFASAACTAALYRFGEQLALDGRGLVLRGATPLFRRVWYALGFDESPTQLV